MLSAQLSMTQPDFLLQQRIDFSYVEKLLQQIQKRFCSSKGNRVAGTQEHQQDQPKVLPRPCDAAAIAIGKELGFEFLQLLLTYHHQHQKLIVSTNNGTDNDVGSADSREWLSVQEKVLNSLCQEFVNPAIPHSFFDVLVHHMQGIQHRKNKKEQSTKPSEGNPILTDSNVTSCFEFLSQWTIQIEQFAIQSHRLNRPSVLANTCRLSSSIDNALLGCIRTYAIYIAIIETSDNSYQKSQEVDDRVCQSSSNKMTTIASPTSDIQKTWLRLQSKSCRWALTQEAINISLMSPSNILLKAARILSPLVASSILGRTLSCREKQRILSYVHRQVWSIWRQYQQDQQQELRNDNPDHALHNETHDDSMLASLEDCLTWLCWMTSLLRTFMFTLEDSLYYYSNDFDEAAAALELADEWLSELVELAWFPMQQIIAMDLNHVDDTASGIKNVHLRRLHKIMSDWISFDILRDLLPKIIAASIYSTSASTISQKSLIQSVTDLIRGMNDECTYYNDGASSFASFIVLDSVSTLRICSLIMVTPTNSDRLALLELLSICISNVGIQNLPAATAMVRALAVQYTQNEYCQVIATSLQMMVEQSSSSSTKSIGPKIDHSIKRTSQSLNLIDLVSSWVQLDGDETDENSLTKAVANVHSFSQTNFSALLQSAAMLYGISLLDCSNSDSKSEDAAYNFLHKLVQQYPHLGISLLTVMTVRLNLASYMQDGKALLRNLEFITASLVADSQAAQEVWNIVGIQWMNEQYSPVTVRVTLIRLFPKLIEGNKRLYRRVMDCLAGCLAGKELGIRLAAASTLAELAQKDFIRDVSDVISHIQGLLSTTEESSISLTPIHSLLVHFGLLSLHHLVLADELDFAVVMQVLKKKFCSVQDLSALLKLPLVVLESFVLLLGDGECGGSSDNDEQTNDTSPCEKIVSTHVRAAVQALIHIATFVRENSSELESSKKNASSNGMLIRVKMNTYYSLSRYSLQALGLEEEGINMAVAVTAGDTSACITESAERYMELRDLVSEAMENLPTGVEGAVSNDGLQDLCRKLIDFEDASLGSSLWQKRGGRSQKDTPETVLSRRLRGRAQMTHESLSFLPSQSEVEALASGSISVSHAIAKLLSCDGTRLSVLRENADESIESSDPFVTAFALQGFLQAASSFVSSKTFSIKNLITEIMSWCEVQVSAETMYLTLCCLSIYIPHDAHDRDKPTPFVEDIYQKTLAAYRGHSFNKGNLLMICFGLLGVSCLRYADINRISELVDILELSVQGYGGQHTFEAYFALAMIARSASHIQNKQSSIETIQLKLLISRTVSFIVDSLLANFEMPSDVATIFLADIKTGTVTPDLIDIISTLGTDAIPMLLNKNDVARDLFICCSLCLPSLTVLSNELLVAAMYMLDSLVWGSGKGFALQSVLKTLTEISESGLKSMTTEHLANIYSGYLSLLEGRIDTSERSSIDSNGLDDLYYTLCGTYWRSSDPAKFRDLIVCNRSLFDNESCKISLLASMNSIASAFCMGTADIWSLGQLDSTAKGLDVKEIANNFASMADTIDDEELSGFCLMILGFLSSIKELRVSIVDSESWSVKEPPVKPQTSSKDAVYIDFTKLPRSANGTLLASIIDVIERLVANKKNEARISRAILSLLNISIPGVYAHSFIEPLLKENVARQACIRLLCFQVVERRRSYVEGKSFLNLIMKICMDSDGGPLDGNEDDNPLEIFLSHFYGVIPKIHLENIEHVLANILEKCLKANSSKIKYKMVRNFLSSLKQCLASKLHSFKVMSVLRMFVISELFSTICSNIDIETSMARTPEFPDSILYHFSLCLKEVPFELLEEAYFFKVYGLPECFQADVYRTGILLNLIQVDYFETPARVMQELSNVSSWLSKRLILPEPVDVNGYRRVACSFAAATIKNSYPSSKRETLSSILDGLLLAKNTEQASLGISWLSIVLAYWCNRNESDSDLGDLCVIDPDVPQLLPNNALDQLFSILMDGLPSRLVCVSRQEKVSAVTSNYLHRLVGLWCQAGVDSDIIDPIRRAILLEHGSMAKEDAFIQLASSFLLTSIVLNA